MEGELGWERDGERVGGDEGGGEDGDGEVVSFGDDVVQGVEVDNEMPDDRIEENEPHPQ